MRRTELRSSPQCLTYARRRWPPSITVRAMCTRPAPNFGPTRRDHEGAARGTPGHRVTCAPPNNPPWQRSRTRYTTVWREFCGAPNSHLGSPNMGDLCVRFILPLFLQCVTICYPLRVVLAFARLFSRKESYAALFQKSSGTGFKL